MVLVDHPTSSWFHAILTFLCCDRDERILQFNHLCGDVCSTAHLSEVNIKARYPFYGGSPRLNCTEAYLKLYQTGYNPSPLHKGSKDAAQPITKDELICTTPNNGEMSSIIVIAI